MNIATTVEGVFHSLHIQYRKIRLPCSELFFCIDCHGTSFDLELGPENAICIWRFICTDLPYGTPGRKISYSHNNRTLGLEITAEMDLNFFSQQNLPADTSEDNFCILRDQINEFLNVNKVVRNKCYDTLHI